MAALNKNYKPGQIVTIEGKRYRIKKTDHEYCLSWNRRQRCEFYGSPKWEMPCRFCVNLYNIGIKNAQMSLIKPKNLSSSR